MDDSGCGSLIFWFLKIKTCLSIVVKLCEHPEKFGKTHDVSNLFAIVFFLRLPRPRKHCLDYQTSKTDTTIQPRIGTHINAIVPTTTGQIGVNPVESDLGNLSTYVGSIYGTDTKYITVDSWSTKVNSRLDLMLSAYSALVDWCKYTILVNGWHFHGWRRYCNRYCQGKWAKYWWYICYIAWGPCRKIERLNGF